ncbi:hypothetical protein E4T56_gene7607, partial [Termitomyces sp. T112]
MVGHLHRPEAGDIAVIDVALDRLAQARRAAAGIHFPAGATTSSCMAAVCASTLASIALAFCKFFEEFGVLYRQRALNFQAGVGPFADPVAIMQIGVAGVAIADKGLVMASARAQRPRPARLARIFGADMALGQELALRLAINAAGDMAHHMAVGIGEAVAGREIARRRDAQQAQTRAAGVALVGALNQLAN